jgi:TPR repeat protein
MDTSREGRRLLVLLGLFTLFAAGCTATLRDGWSAYERQDGAAAIASWRPLAESGDPDAQYLIGLVLDEGHGVPADPAEAAAWYRRAAEHGSAAAQNNLGLLYWTGRGVVRSEVEAARWFDRAADQGFAKAASNRVILH